MNQPTASDDALGAHLRSAADHVLPVMSLDPARLVRAGRRRRLARQAGAALGSALAVGGLVAGLSVAAPRADPTLPADPLTTAQSSTSPSPSPPPDPRPAGAVVDETTGTIGLPLDAWQLTPSETAAIDTAQALAKSRCLTDRGLPEMLPYDGPDLTALEWESWSNGYGVWIRDHVAQYGYGIAPELLVDESGKEDWTVEEFAADGACTEQLREAGLVVDHGTIETGRPARWTPAETTQDGQTVLAQWAECLAEHGVQRPDEEGGQIVGVFPAGVLDLSLDEQVRVGLIDVDCKRELGTIQQLADIEASLHLDYIERYRDDLEAQQARNQEALAAARAYLDEAGVVLPD